MAVKVNIKKILSLTLWCIVGAGALVLLVAAIGYRNNKTCKGYRIDITGGASGVLFNNKRQILDLLTAGMGRLQEKPTTNKEQQKKESELEKIVWIKDAELFFDNN